MCTHTSILIWFGQVHELSPNFVPGEQASSVKIICYLDKLIELVGCHCRECHLPCRLVKRRLFGCSITIRTECEAGHVFMWSSSPVMKNANNAMIYECNMAFASSVLLSGNNFYKIHQLCRFLDLKCISLSTFFAYQRLFLCPVIQNFYDSNVVSAKNFHLSR